MNFERREYLPFNLDGTPYTFTRKDKRIAYDARTFNWVTTETAFEPHTDDVEKIGRVFGNLQLNAVAKADCDRRSMSCYVMDRAFNYLWNGNNHKPKGLTGSCKVVGCIPSLTCRLTLHAEQEALNGVHMDFDQEGLYLFNTAVPCLDCQKLCLARNVKRVFYLEERDQPEYDRPIMSAITMFSGLEFIKVEL